MKYIKPKYDLSVLEASDILLASGDKFEITKNDDGTGNVIFDAIDIF